MLDNPIEWFSSHLGWELFWHYIFLPLMTAILVTAPVKYALGQLQSRKNTILFGGSVFLLVCLFVVFGGGNQQNPDLHPQIIAAAYGGHSAEGNMSSPVMLMVSITNSGNMPIVATDYDLKALLLDEHELTGVRQKLPPSMSFEAAGGKTETYYETDALYQKTLKPIPVGGMVVGILLFTFPTMAEDAFKEKLKTITLTFQDVRSHTYSASASPIGTMLPPNYIPGLTQSIH